MIRGAAALAAALAVLAAPVAAWACGDGGGGGDGGSSGGGASGGGDSSSSGGGDSSSSSDSAAACFDTSDVHGYRSCAGFGAWRARRVAVAIELAAVSSRLDLAGLVASGDISHSDGSNYTYRVVGEDLGGTADARGVALRTLLHGRHGYLGIESAFAVVDGGERERMTTAEGAMLSPRVAGVTTALGIVGTRRFADRLVGALAPRSVSLGVELAGGVRMVAVEAESRKGACITTDRTIHTTPVVEARARVDLWLSPHVAVGVWGGTDLLARTPSAGLVLSSHLRAFDGTR